jgi:predicted ester cyclase
MSFIDNKATARSYLEHVVGQGNMSAADAIFEPAIQFHYPLGDLSGAGAVKDYLAAVRAAFPDIHFTIEDLVAEGDRVAARWTLTGTQTGELRGSLPTGHSVSVPGITIFHVVNAKIREMWIVFDPARLIKSC